MSRLDVAITLPQSLGATRRAQVVELLSYVFGGPSLTKALAKAGIDEVRVTSKAPAPPQATDPAE